ncbi:hypothetical protein J6590_012528 [Homalodisca vitripennis]|nr:hypothetical protein J6590_012528 [Homalodisca vitripennis]
MEQVIVELSAGSQRNYTSLHSPRHGRCRTVDYLSRMLTRFKFYISCSRNVSTVRRRATFGSSHFMASSFYCSAVHGKVKIQDDISGNEHQNESCVPSTHHAVFLTTPECTVASEVRTSCPEYSTLTMHHRPVITPDRLHPITAACTHVRTRHPRSPHRPSSVLNPHLLSSTCSTVLQSATLY